MSISTSTVSSLTNMAAEQAKSFTFGTVDYVVFVVMLLISASIGVYFGFFSKAKNTTDEYLMGGKKMKTLPIAISLVASQLSGIAIMSVPAETYTFGICYIIFTFVLVIVIPILCYIIIPVFYENNISNCYEYLELRFNKRTRQFVTATFIFNSFLMLPVWMFVPSLALSQVSGLNVHIINSAVCFICVFYTMLGGIKAVVWTDVVQAGIMLSAVFSVGFLGMAKTGGLGKVLEYASAGGRLDISLSWDLRVRTTLWNTIVNGIFLWTGHIGLNQSCVQRIVSLPSIKHAQRSLKIAGVGMIAIMSTTSFIGIIMFARYYGCDPIKAGLVAKPDRMMPFFVQDIMGHLLGMPGVFISCVFSAALSTMSANLNSLSGVLYFDYIKPFIKHSDAHANYLMKLIVIVMGIYCVSAGLIVEHFSSILQAIISITGTNTGAVCGIFLTGMFMPRVNGKVAFLSIFISVGVMLVIIVNSQIRFKTGAIVYSPLPTTLDQCEARNFTFAKHYTTTAMPMLYDSTVAPTNPPLVTTAFDSNRPFSIFEISFYWYKVVGVIIFCSFAMILSYIWPRDYAEKLNPKLFAPFVRKYLPEYGVEMEEMPLRGDGNKEKKAVITVETTKSSNDIKQ